MTTNVFFTVKAKKDILAIINEIFEEDLYSYPDYDENSGTLEMSLDYRDHQWVCGYVSIIQRALNENGFQDYSFYIRGTTDRDEYQYTAFEINCDNSAIKIRYVDFDAEPSNDEWDETEYEESERRAFSALEEEPYREADNYDMTYDDYEQDYESVFETVEDYLSSLDE